MIRNLRMRSTLSWMLGVLASIVANFAGVRSRKAAAALSFVNFVVLAPTKVYWDWERARGPSRDIPLVWNILKDACDANGGVGDCRVGVVGRERGLEISIKSG